MLVEADVLRRLPVGRVEFASIVTADRDVIDSDALSCLDLGAGSWGNYKAVLFLANKRRVKRDCWLVSRKTFDGDLVERSGSSVGQSGAR